MKKENTQPDYSALGKVILLALKESGMSIKDLAGKLNKTYEHARRIV